MGFDSYNRNQTIFSLVDLDDSGEWPFSRDKTIFLEDNDVSNRGISRGVMLYNVHAEI